jgi:hypothetical protein
MHRRLRWGNVARAAGVVVLITVVVGWPRLAPPEPRLPGPEAAPLGGTRPGEVREPRRDKRRRAGEAAPAGRRRDPASPERLAPPGRKDHGADQGRAEPQDHGAGSERTGSDDHGGGGGAQDDHMADGGAHDDDAADGGAHPDDGADERAGAERGAPPLLDPAQVEFGFERGR